LCGHAQPKQAELELQDSSRVGLMIGVHISDLRRNGEKV
jgi:hypothetical protein